MTVNIGGKDRPVKFTNNALIELADEHQIDVLKSPEFTSPKVIRAMCFVALKHGARAEKKELDFTIEDVGDWIDLANPEIVGKIFSALKNQTATDQTGESKGE